MLNLGLKRLNQPSPAKSAEIVDAVRGRILRDVSVAEIVPHTHQVAGGPLEPPAPYDLSRGFSSAPAKSLPDHDPATSDSGYFDVRDVEALRPWCVRN